MGGNRALTPRIVMECNEVHWHALALIECKGLHQHQSDQTQMRMVLPRAKKIKLFHP